MIGSIKPDVSITPLREAAPFEAASEMVFLIRIIAPRGEIESTRPRLNLGLVLDRSGSMSGSKIEKAKEAAAYCVDQLLETDSVSVTAFDQTVEVIVPARRVENREKIRRQIGSITTGGTTALHAAWVEGAKQVAECADPLQLNRVLLITDGLANEGITHPETIVSQARGLFERGISTSTIGIGNDFNEDLLVAMAGGAGGNSWFVEGPKDFQRIFQTEMEGLLREVCSKVSLAFTTAEGVEILEVLNDFERTADGAFHLPSLLAGDPLDVVARVKLPGGAPGRFHCFKLLLRWREHGSGNLFSLESSTGITFASGKEAAAHAIDPSVEKALRLLEGARIKRRAMEHLDRGDFQAASFSLRSQLSALSAMPAAPGDPIVAVEMEQLSMLCDDLESARDLAKARKSMAYQSANTQRGRRQKERSPGHGSFDDGK